jgi:hypothetical protein
MVCVSMNNGDAIFIVEPLKQNLRLLIPILSGDLSFFDA